MNKNQHIHRRLINPFPQLPAIHTLTMNSMLIEFNSGHSRKLKVNKKKLVSSLRPFRILESERRAVLSSLRKAGNVVPIPILFLGKFSITIVQLQSLLFGQLLLLFQSLLLLRSHENLSVLFYSRQSSF